MQKTRRFFQKKSVKVIGSIILLGVIFATGFCLASWRLLVTKDGFVAEDNTQQAIPSEPMDNSENQPTIGEASDLIFWYQNWQTVISSEDDPSTPVTVKIGEVKSDSESPYAGWGLFMNMPVDMGDTYSYFVYLGDKPVAGKEVIIAEDDPLLSDLLDYPSSIQYKGFTFKNFGSLQMFSDWKDDSATKITIGGRAYYTTGHDCLIFERYDHLAAAYSLVVPFVGEEGRLAEITFSDGKKNSDSYSYTTPSCGMFCLPMSVVLADEVRADSRLVEVGKTSTGEKIFEIKDFDDSVLKDLYNDKNTVAYLAADGNFEDRVNQYTYEQFLSYHPLLYWQDPFGNWVQFKNDRFMMAAEICKPYIYLYPEKTTDLTVKVAPNGGFTTTVPAYNNGWKVTAKPDGELLVGGQKYSYLFWEGIGIYYPEQTSGFVVSRDQLASFLQDKLTLLGLRDQELKDFMGYWVPRLTDLNKPFYKLSFLEKNQIDAIAPLTIGPEKPQTVLRIIMTAKGLDTYEPIKEQKLTPAPARSGFTVIEWGGAVLE